MGGLHQLALRAHQVGLEGLVGVVAVAQVRVEGELGQVQHTHVRARRERAALVVLREGVQEAVGSRVAEDEQDVVHAHVHAARRAAVASANAHVTHAFLHGSGVAHSAHGRASLG